MNLNFWIALGFLSQFVFFLRFFVQWIASEKAKKSVIPTQFWFLSLVGGVGLFVYAIHIKDPVFILGQSMGILIYIRNLFFIYKNKEEKTKNV
jgi:lipid-A-disaccharide synthase-like uncharacterized protein